MKLWTRHHEALLGALRAEQLIPRLYRRLSLERYEADEDELRRLVDWPGVLLEEPAWAFLEPVLDQPDAWPAAWHQATERGFGPLADHHHALLFGRLTDRFLRDEEYEHALWSWTECISAWRRVLGSAYPGRLLEDLIEDAEALEPEALAARRAVVTELLDELVDARASELVESLGLAEGQDLGQARPEGGIDRRAARLAWSALALVGELIPQGLEGPEDPFGALRRARSRARQARDQARARAVTRFQARCEQVEWAEAPAPQILAPFEWVTEAFELLGVTDHAATTVVTKTVETGWKLRHMGRDDEDDLLARLVATAAPFNDELCGRLEGGETFGHNSKCADFLVFQGEPLTDHGARRALFERALAICPGHRNASMLMSYEHLQQANELIGQLRMIPASSRHVPGNSRPRRLTEQAWAAVERARQAYPFNEDLESYQSRVRAQADRLGVELPDEQESP